MTDKYLKMVLITNKDIFILTREQLNELTDNLINEINCKVLFYDKIQGYKQIRTILTSEFIHNKKYKVMTLKEYLEHENKKLELLKTNFNNQ